MTALVLSGSGTLLLSPRLRPRAMSLRSNKQEVAIAEALGSSAGTRGAGTRGRFLVERCLLACSISDLRFGPLAGRGLEAPEELEVEFVVSWHHRKNTNGHGLKRSDLDLEFEIVVLSRTEKNRMVMEKSVRKVLVMGKSVKKVLQKEPQ